MSQEMTQFAVDYIDEELEVLYSIALPLCERIAPKDPKNLQEEDDIVAWRLAQLLVERLESTRTINNLKQFLGVTEMTGKSSL